MTNTIKRESGEHYFNGDFVETILFTNGKFVIMYNGVAIVNNCYGQLPDGVNADTIIRIRMADHKAPDGIECGPVAVFMMSDGRVMIYEYWTNPKMCHSTGTNGFWKNKTGIKITNSLINTQITLIDTIDEEKSNDIVKVTKSKLIIDKVESYDL